MYFKKYCIFRRNKIKLNSSQMKEKFELEYLFNTSPGVLEKLLSTPSGLSEWFADDVNIKDDVYTFFWDGSSEEARLLQHRPNQKIKFKWLEDDEDEYYFEISMKVDPMTNDLIMTITDFAYEDEIDGAELLWDQQIDNLRRTIGA